MTTQNPEQLSPKQKLSRYQSERFQAQHESEIDYEYRSREAEEKIKSFLTVFEPIIADYKTMGVTMSVGPLSELPHDFEKIRNQHAPSVEPLVYTPLDRKETDLGTVNISEVQFGDVKGAHLHIRRGINSNIYSMDGYLIPLAKVGFDQGFLLIKTNLDDKFESDFFPDDENLGMHLEALLLMFLGEIEDREYDLGSKANLKTNKNTSNNKASIWD